MTRSPVLLLALSTLLGCASDWTYHPEKTQAGTAVFSLKGDAGGLRLVSGQKNPAYRATYPNPEGVGEMSVSVAQNGGLLTSCTDAEGRALTCRETPFLVNVRELGNRQGSYRVIDLYGEVIAEFEAPCAGLPPGEGGEGTGTGGTPASCNPDKEECTAVDGGEAPIPGTPGGGGGSCADVKQQICDRINAKLKELKIDHVVDCSKVSESFPTGPQTPPTPKNYIPCHDVVENNLFDMWSNPANSACTITINNVSQNIKQELIQAGACVTSPLVLDLDGDGVKLSSMADGVPFDLNAERQQVQTAWPTGGDGVLALDRNGNGTIDDGAELFGNVTLGRFYEDGFKALADLDTNRDGRVDAKDPAFSKLLVWTEQLRDGVSQPGELKRLSQVRVVGLELAARRVDPAQAADAHGNWVPLVGRFLRADGRSGVMVDAYLRYRPLGPARLQVRR